MELSSIINKIFLKLLPSHCLLCGMNSAHEGFCAPCLAELPWLKQSCGRCGYALAVNAQVCGECLKRSPPYDHTLALFEYKFPIDHAILSLKFRKNLPYAQVFGQLLCDALRKYYHDGKYPDIILPVPLHAQRLRERGFNQALEIIRPVAKALKIPVSLDECVRVIPTQPQMSISLENRIKNVKQAFVLRKTIKAEHVAIFDDVVTTGSTVSEITRLLKQHGVRRVDIWCCARTM